MSTQCRAGCLKRKAPKGVYSDRYGPWVGRPDAAARSGIAASSPEPTGPMLHGMPLYGVPQVTPIQNLKPIRR